MLWIITLFYLRNSAECGSHVNTCNRIPHHTHHTNTQYSWASDTQHTILSAFLSFITILRGTMFDDFRAGTLWYTELANFTKWLSQFWMKIAPYHWFIIVKYWNWFHCLFSPNCHSPGFVTMIGGYHNRNFFIALFCHRNKSCMLRYDFTFLQFCIFHFRRHVLVIQL
jgi:hypothetical protein